MAFAAILCHKFPEHYAALQLIVTISPVMDNQLEKSMGHGMDAGIMEGLILLICTLGQACLGKKPLPFDFHT